jgi:hypothetical protein
MITGCSKCAWVARKPCYSRALLSWACYSKGCLMYSTNVCCWVVGVSVIKLAGQLFSKQLPYSAAASSKLLPRGVVRIVVRMRC